MHYLLRRDLGLDESDLTQLVAWIAAADGWGLLGRYPSAIVVRHVERLVNHNAPGVRLKKSLAKLSSKLRQHERDSSYRKLADRIDAVLGTKPELPLRDGETWAERARADIEAVEAKRHCWIDLIEHCGRAAAGSPSAKWIAASSKLLEEIGPDDFRSHVIEWFPLVDQPRTQRIERWSEYEPDPNQLIIDPHADILKGLAWCCGLTEDKDVSRALTSLALSAYKKVPGIGPRATKIGNACVWALGNMPGMEGVGQLALLRVRVKFGTAQKMIEKALAAAAHREGLPREELDEMAVPTYGLADVGIRRETLGDYVAELTVTGTATTELRWIRPDGKPQKSVPAAVKKDHADDLKELKHAAKDIQRMLPAQRDRIDQLFLQQKRWPLATWRERYLDHPLVGCLARRIIWRFVQDEAGSGRSRSAVGIWHDGRIVDQQGRPVDWVETATGESSEPHESTRVELWHPIGEPVEDIVAWRRRLEAHEVRQPFKQAHREIYLLTDAEKNTVVYSNRFAAHIIRQHQFNALCAVRGWKNKLRLLVDDEYPPAMRLLPAWNLRAEFWIEGIGDDYGVDTNETGTFYRLTTDQVRFYPIESSQRTAHAAGGGYETRGPEGSDTPAPLEDVPPLVFSEIMRDVDLFVGVASVGNDPTWSDGGPEARYREYWQDYAFGDLNENAKTRKDVLERLLPRLKIAKRCSLSDKFLVVRGDVRTYKIHLGSGNILMKPNDQYLCIVKAPARGGADKMYLPFEGDQTLSVILSKALLLADDAKIEDRTILSQINAR